MQPLKIIKHALDSTISLINKGEKPTVALEKVARELDLNPNFIQRTGEALNVALFYGHMKTASDKAADFDMGDIKSVTKNIFGETEKTDAQKKAEWFPKQAEDIDYNKLLTNPKYKTASAAIKATEAKNESYEITMKGQFKKAQDYLSRLDREIDELKTEKVAADTHVEAAFLSLITGFKKEASARIPFHEFESQVFAEHGERAVPYLDLIYKSANLSEERGTQDAKYIAYTPARETQVFGSFLKAASDKASLQKEIDDAESFIDSQKGSFKQASYKLNPMAAAFDKVACDKLADDLDFLLEKEAMGDFGKSVIQDFVSQFKNSDAANKKPVFPNTKADNHERTAILQELIMTDEILKKQDPRKIVQAYQQILRLSPQLTKEKEVLRAKLREMMAGQALHPTDAKQLIETNTEYLKQHEMLHKTEGGDHQKKDKK